MSDWLTGQVDGQGRCSRSPQTSMSIGFWDRDAFTGHVTGDEGFASLLGLDVELASTGLTIDQVVQNLRGEAREAAWAIFSGESISPDHQDNRFAIVREDGSLGCVAIYDKPVQAFDGAKGQASGVVVDMPAQVEPANSTEDNEFRFRALAEALPQNVFSSDAQGVHDFLNKRWYEFTGHPHGPVASDVWLNYLHIDDRPRTLKLWNECLAEGKPYDVEYRYLRHDGQYRWMRVMALPERDQDGQITRWFGTATDIHDTKLIEAEREVISDELSHRIKNLFSVFAGLISLSARADKGANEFADAVQKRLSSLALAHDFIGLGSVGEEQGQSGSLHALFEALAAPYGGEGEGRVFQCTGQDVMISKTAITPITLIAHELLTNAVKYGAFAVPDGSIKIHTLQDEEGLHIYWHEAWSNALDVVGSNAGFGSGMLTTVVERLLRGRWERTLHARGLDVHLILPLDKILVRTR